MNYITVFFFLLICFNDACCQVDSLRSLTMIDLSTNRTDSNLDTYRKSLVNYDDYEALVKEVKVVRENRLISLDTFLSYQEGVNTIVLDTRSAKNYNAIHIKGALHLPFTEFTTNNLRQLIPNTNTRILIYCNNNISGDPVYFGSKTYYAEDDKKRKKYNAKATFVDKSYAVHNSKMISLALNVPTYINLYGYGYRNIYELDELVDLKDKRIEFKRKGRN